MKTVWKCFGKRLADVHGFSLNIGGQNGSSGAGGDVNVFASGPITTSGLDAHAILAQSIGGGGGSTGGDVPLDQFAATYAAVFCQKAFTCCDAAELAGDSMTGIDEATCRSTYAAGISANMADYPASIAAGRIIYHGDRARRCFDAIAALPCAQWGADEELRRFPDCLHMTEGTVAPGGECTRTVECDDGSCNSGNGTTNICVANARISESCTSRSCQPELSRASDSSGLPTVCATPLPDGSACSYDSDCASTFCEARVCGPPTMCNGV
jgi:hypothetical protein